MTLTITLLGTGSPMPSPDRAGPATLISAGDGAEWKALAAEHFSGTVEVGDDLHQITISGNEYKHSGSENKHSGSENKQ